MDTKNIMMVVVVVYERLRATGIQKIVYSKIAQRRVYVRRILRKLHKTQNEHHQTISTNEH